MCRPEVSLPWELDYSPTSGKDVSDCINCFSKAGLEEDVHSNQIRFSYK